MFGQRQALISRSARNGTVLGPIDPKSKSIETKRIELKIICYFDLVLFDSSIRPIPAAAAGPQAAFLPGAAARKYRVAILLGSILDFSRHGVAFASANVVVVGRTTNGNGRLEPSRSHPQRCYRKWENLRGAPAGRVQLLRPLADPHRIGSHTGRMHLRKSLLQHFRRIHLRPDSHSGPSGCRHHPVIGHQSGGLSLLSGMKLNLMII